MQSKSFFQITLEYLPTYPFLYWNPFKVLIKVWSDEFDIWHLSRVTNWNLRHWNGRWWWRNIWMIGGLDGNNYVTDIVTFVLRWVNVTLESAQICPVKVQLYVMSYITFVTCNWLQYVRHIVSSKNCWLLSNYHIVHNLLMSYIISELSFSLYI